MTEHHIDLSSLIPRGRIETKYADGVLDIWTTRSITPISFNLYGDSYKGHGVALPGKYRLPLRVEMTVRLDYPSFFLFVGGGHISFASPWQDNRKIEDIAIRSGKPNQDHASYNNSLPYGKYAEISVTYNLNEIQILIDGDERFYSRRQAYVRAKNLGDLNAEGFELGLAVTKLSLLSIKSLTVTEYDGQAPVARGVFEIQNPRPAAEERAKPTFESVIAGIPLETRFRVIETDIFLKSLKPMKFRRIVDKNGGKISYVASDFGISYAVNVSGAESMQNFGWYIVTNGKPETWGRKADNMEETLAEIAKTDAPLAERIFYALNDCVGCYGSRCLAKTPYSFNGHKRLACHGRVVMHLGEDGARDAREFFRHLNAMYERKMNERVL
jgi:hypothetical protein